jgi:predicted esterase
LGAWAVRDLRNQWRSPIAFLLNILLKWKFLIIFLLTLLFIFSLHLSWRAWLLSVPQPLPQVSILGFGQKDSLQLGSYYEASIPPTGTDKYISADYRLWIPNGVGTIRGLIVKQHRCEGDATTELGLSHANDLQWQALASKHGFALLGARFPTDYQTVGKYQGDACDSWDIVDSGSGNALLKAIRDLAKKSNHPELETLPWVLWGHSGGADWSIEMSKKYSDRIIAVVAMRCGMSSLLSNEIKSEMLGIPVLIVVGEKDPYADECIDLPKKTFSRYRKAGAIWTLAIEAEAGHEAADTRHLVIPYLDAILSTRLPKTDPKIYPVKASQGWLGNLTTHKVEPIGQYQGNPLEAAWLPDQETARKWQGYVTPPNFWNRMRYQLCSHKKIVTLLGAPHLSESCFPDKISPIRRPAAPTNVRLTKNSGSEVVVSWDFTPDLENGLPKFRIYRDRSLIATLQGQGYNGGDEPEPLKVVLEFCDRESTANATYTVSAFNALGESELQPSQ